PRLIAVWRPASNERSEVRLEASLLQSDHEVLREPRDVEALFPVVVVEDAAHRDGIRPSMGEGSPQVEQIPPLVTLPQRTELERRLLLERRSGDGERSARPSRDEQLVGNGNFAAATHGAESKIPLPGVELELHLQRLLPRRRRQPCPPRRVRRARGTEGPH